MSKKRRKVAAHSTKLTTCIFQLLLFYYLSLVVTADLPPGHALAKAIRRNLEKIIQHLDSDDVITYLYQEDVINTTEYQLVGAEVADEIKVAKNSTFSPYFEMFI